MIFAKDGDLNIDGTQHQVIKDWCYLTDEIFRRLFDNKEERFKKMRDAIEFVIESHDELRKAEKVNNET